MGTPTSRLLELLELLQAKPLVTGRELGDRLGIDRRTVRRDIATLQRLGSRSKASAGSAAATACARATGFRR
jgi:predicted DNA-binding transcriptional regulator YafY